MKIVSIDLETSSLDPQRGQILEFAAVIDDTEKPEIPVEELPYSQLIVVKRDYSIRGDPVAIAMNIDLIKMIGEIANVKSGKSAVYKWCYEDTLGTIFDYFMAENRFDYGPYVLTGKNVAMFDLKFLNEIENWKLQPRYPHHRIVEPGTFFARADDKVPPDMKTCLERAGIEKSVTHRALDDARDVVRLIRKGFANKGL
jgi:oligoribonuclease (3'-5' exoribonuclease)